MASIAKLTKVRAGAITLLALTSGLAASWADVIQSTVQLPPPSGSYTTAGICVAALDRCTEDVAISNFTILSDTEMSGNEVVMVDAVYSAEVYTDNGGAPDTFVGTLSMPGTAVFTYVGRNPSVDPLGTFTTDLTDFDFSGTLNGNTFQVIPNPSIPSAGSTTILEITFVPPIEYSVTGSLEIFGEYSFNGGPFTPTPGQSAGLTGVPEPASGALTALIVVGLFGIASRQRVV